jgi:hypothetical protein
MDGADAPCFLVRAERLAGYSPPDISVELFSRICNLPARRAEQQKGDRCNLGP